MSKIRVAKSRENAILPSKTHDSDSGYDLTIIEKIKTVGNTDFFTTGIKIEPEDGWYVDVVPRSSIGKTGYILANSVGIIDNSYRGEIIIALKKVDPIAQEIELPCRIAQMIPRKVHQITIEEVSEEELGDTSRGTGGFGSTGR